MSISRGNGDYCVNMTAADRHGHVKGYVKNPWVILPNNAQGHLNVGGGVGKGILTVIRDMGRGDPYSGQVPLRSGEIAEDLTYYFAASEQIPSSVGLGVLVDGSGHVLEAGGYIIQSGKELELRCHFCGKTYTFPLTEVKSLRQEVVSHI